MDRIVTVPVLPNSNLLFKNAKKIFLAINIAFTSIKMDYFLARIIVYKNS